MNHELIATSSKQTRLMKRVCFGSWSEEMTFDQMNEFVLLRPGAGSRSERGRWKDSMKHDLAARICLLLNHSLYLQPEAPVTQFTLRALNFVPILRLKAMTGNKLFKKIVESIVQ